ncbi:UDP-glycosyltransferase 76B1-like [Magnolia sinica]|uniref:UDP-glycosyltransferase 76B1-like n=1 Tax=Magnolia sinica TaxID=86752 RepID=UPI00265A8484|nr:UDP-glycosyltransferase 76B1-like [Magnolia sinica]
MARSEERPMQHRKRTHLILFPCPLQGHITPMLQLATILHSKGFSITIVHTHFNSPNPSNHPSFNFEPISDGLTADQTRKDDVMGLVALLNVNCHGPFNDLMARMLSEENPRDPIACIVSDALMHFTQSVADHLKIPRMILRTSSATSFVTCAAFPLLREKGYLPIQDPQSETPVSELPPLRIKDLPDISTDNSDTLYKLVAHMNNETRNSSGLIYNSFDHIEETALEKIRQDFPIPFFPIGPLHKYSSGSSSSLLQHDHSCIFWLDKQAAGSVIYVSFGSLASMVKKEVEEIAWGLANSGQPFLWVVRPGLLRGSVRAEMPNGFEEETQGRGLVVKWAPQQEVLAHPSVGGFWTHNGWNSTVESICEGVPMLCWPCFGDQKVNARLVSHVLKVGVQLENGLEREKIGWAIRRLMVEKEGEEMRKRIMKLKEKADRCLRKGGSSYESVDRLVNCILSL